MTKRWMLAVPYLARLGLPLLGGLLAFVLWLQLSGNLHQIVEGQYYRSAQLDADRLEEVVGRYGIRSILNLRGAKPGHDWYDAEIALATRRHVAHYDIPLSARRMVSPETLDAILALLHQVPKPVLIHCKGGADRSGLVSALIRLRQGDSPREARQQLGLRYGHVPWLGNATVAMDRSFDLYLRTEGADSGPRQRLTASSP